MAVYLTATPAHKAGATAFLPAGNRVEQNDTGVPVEEVLIELKPGSPPLPPHTVTLDPVKLDPKYHTVDFENNRVRILRTGPRTSYQEPAPPASPLCRGLRDRTPHHNGDFGWQAGRQRP